MENVLIVNKFDDRNIIRYRITGKILQNNIGTKQVAMPKYLDVELLSTVIPRRLRRHNDVPVNIAGRRLEPTSALNT